MSANKLVLTLGAISDYLVDRERKNGEDIPTVWLSVLADVQAIVTQGEGLAATINAASQNVDYCEQ